MQLNEADRARGTLALLILMAVGYPILGYIAGYKAGERDTRQHFLHAAEHQPNAGSPPTGQDT
jgi:hypothetical protein